MDSKKTLKNLALYLGIPILLIILLVSVYGSFMKPQETYKFSEIVSLFKNQQVTAYTMNLGSGEMVITIKGEDGQPHQIRYTSPSASLMYEEIQPYVEEYNEANPQNEMIRDYERPADTSFIASFLPTIILLVIMGAFWWFMMRRLNASMGLSLIHI